MIKYCAVHQYCITLYQCCHTQEADIYQIYCDCLKNTVAG